MAMVTVHENCVHQYGTDCKCSSMQWNTTGYSTPVELRKSSFQKNVCSLFCFFKFKCVLLKDYLLHGTMRNGQYCADVLYQA